MIYIVSIIFTVVFVIYQKWQFIDDCGGVSGKWHKWGALLRVILFGGGYLLQKFPSTWQDYIFAASINILMWEILINIVALKQHWWYNGSTASFDKILGQYKWIIMVLLIVICSLIKIFTN